MRIDLDKRQAEELARFITENHDRIPWGLHLTGMATRGNLRSVRVEGRGSDGRITANAMLRPRREA